jgi:hypothetical protein
MFDRCSRCFSLLFISFLVLSCSGNKGNPNPSKLSLTSVTGDLSSRRVRHGIKVTGDYFDSSVVVTLLTEAGAKVADLAITSASAQEIDADLPLDTTPGTYVLRLTKGQNEVSTTVSILQGEQGPKGDTGAKGDKGDTGDIGATGATGSTGSAGAPGATGATGATGPKGDKGDTGLGALHAIDGNDDDIGYVLDVDAGVVKVWFPPSTSHDIDMATGFDLTTPEPPMIKTYFPTADCSGPPYTYAPLTLPNTAYRDGSNYLMTTATQVTLSIATVHNVGGGSCDPEGASYALWTASWYTPVPDYQPPITIEPR